MTRSASCRGAWPGGRREASSRTSSGGGEAGASDGSGDAGEDGDSGIVVGVVAHDENIGSDYGEISGL